MESKNSPAIQFSEYSGKEILLEVQEGILEVVPVAKMNKMHCEDKVKQHQHNNGRRYKTHHMSGITAAAGLMFLSGGKVVFSMS